MKLTKKTTSAMREAAAYLEGKATKVRVTKLPAESVNVRVIRSHLNLSQVDFAKRYGFPVSTVRNWEQGRRQPEGAARLLLKVIETKPEVVEEALRHSAA